jgi:hypothetical protein
MTFSQIKKQEANQRMRAMRQARKSKRAALAVQRRASLIGEAKWRITNLTEVAGSTTKWV